MSLEHLHKKVLVSCCSCGKDIFRSVGPAVRHEFHFCEECWPERQREISRNYETRHARKRKARRRIANITEEQRLKVNQQKVKNRKRKFLGTEQ